MPNYTPQRAVTTFTSLRTTILPSANQKDGLEARFSPCSSLGKLALRASFRRGWGSVVLSFRTAARRETQELVADRTEVRETGILWLRMDTQSIQMVTGKAEQG